MKADPTAVVADHGNGLKGLIQRAWLIVHRDKGELGRGGPWTLTTNRAIDWNTLRVQGRIDLPDID